MQFSLSRVAHHAIKNLSSREVLSRSNLLEGPSGILSYSLLSSKLNGREIEPQVPLTEANCEPAVK
jgi:hypothetical protein